MEQTESIEALLKKKVDDFCRPLQENDNERVNEVQKFFLEASQVDISLVSWVGQIYLIASSVHQQEQMMQLRILKYNDPLDCEIIHCVDLKANMN